MTVNFSNCGFGKSSHLCHYGCNLGSSSGIGGSWKCSSSNILACAISKALRLGFGDRTPIAILFEVDGNSCY